MKKIIINLVLIFLLIISLYTQTVSNQSLQEFIRTSPVPTRVSLIKAVFSAETGNVKLTWSRVPDFTRYKYRIYRDVKVINEIQKLRTAVFITEIDASITEYIDKTDKSGKYFYAITVVDPNNKEFTELVKDQSFISNPVEVIALPQNVVSIQVIYELGKKEVIIRWKIENIDEIQKFNIYRDTKPIEKISEDKKIAEVLPDLREYKDVIKETGRYFYVITSINKFNRENKKIINNENYTSNPISVRFFSVRVPVVEGYDYYTELDVNKEHPPILFRFISEIFRERENFSQFDINDVKPFKEVNSTLLSLPELPRDYRVDDKIERLTPLNEPTEEQRREIEREEREEIERRQQTGQRERESQINQIFTPDPAQREMEEQNRERERQLRETEQRQREQERRQMSINERDPSENRTVERVRPDTDQTRDALQKQEKLKKDSEALRQIISNYYYKLKNYNKAMNELHKLYKETNFDSIKHRAIYFYGKSLFELGEKERSLKAFLALKGSVFYDKFKNEIDFMIKRAMVRN